MDCQESDNSTIFYNKSCMAISTVCSSFGFYDGGNVTHCFDHENVTALRNLYTRVLSSEQYFR